MNTQTLFYLLLQTQQPTALFRHALLSTAANGIVCLILLFVFCFLCIHLLKFAQIGWTYQNNQTEKPTEPPIEKAENKENKAPAQNPQEPIYYIVEKKTKRAKSSYGEPKQIRFK
jgi:hypothetical protein